MVAKKEKNQISEVLHPLENSVPDDHDGLIYWSDKIVVEIDEAGSGRLERSHPVSCCSVRWEVKTASCAVLSVHLRSFTEEFYVVFDTTQVRDALLGQSLGLVLKTTKSNVAKGNINSNQ